MQQGFSGGGVDLSNIVQPAQQQAAIPQNQPAAPAQSVGSAAPGQVVDVPSIVLTITDDTFEQLMQLSNVVPVVVALGAEECAPCHELEPTLEKITKELGGRVLLAKVDAERNRGLQQAFQVQQLPTVVAVIAGQAIPMFQGLQSEEQIREVFTQLLAVSAQQGVVGTANAPDLDAGTEAEPEPSVNPEHEAALEALDRGDYAAAVSEYERVLQKFPRDAEAQAALAQVRLLVRLSGANASDIRAKAAAEPHNLEAQFAVADLDVSGGHIEDAFLRLLDIFADADAEDRNLIRERLLELFEVVGHDDSRVKLARANLTNLLFS